MNRWFVVIGALLIQLCLGAIYAWSAFTADLTKALDKGGQFGFTAAQSQWVFSVGLAVFAVVMVLAGKLQAKIGPRPVAVMGGIGLGLGYILASYFGQTFWGMLLCIGVVGGAGIGLAYVIPITVGIQWFPKKKGLITGIAVAGFGFGALIWVKLAGSWGHLIATHGVLGTFRLYGIVFFAAVLVGSIWMVKPKEFEAAAKGAAGAGIPKGMLPKQTLKTSQFYMIWLTFMFGAGAGLMVIGIIKLFAIDALKGGGLDAAAAGAIAGSAMGYFYAIPNGIGRIAWGSISDALGRQRSIILMCLIQGIMMFAFYFLGRTEYMLYLFAALVGFNFGGNFALFPAITADYFGSATVARNYGWVFTSYGVGGILGPVMAGYFKDMGAGKGVEAWMPPFMIAGICLIVVALLMTRVKSPEASAAEEPSPAAPPLATAPSK